MGAPESARADGARSESETTPAAPAGRPGPEARSGPGEGGRGERVEPQARVHVCFSGQVQGVGFRYTARALAQRYSVVGFVRNLADGRVELEAEGPPRQVRAYLEELQRAFRHYIGEQEVRWLAPTGEYRRFEVRFASGR